MTDEYYDMKRLSDERKVKDKERHEELSKNRLRSIAEKKILTATIGALSSIEEFFGFLWGHGNNDDLTDEQNEFKESYEKLRSEILDKGNNQSRNLKAEFEQYTIVWNRYSMTLPIKNIQEEQNDE